MNKIHIQRSGVKKQTPRRSPISKVKIFDYVTFFRDLLATLTVADASREMIEQVRHIANAPIWDDRAACLEIADACEQLGEWQANGEGTDAQDSIRELAMARLRGEDVCALEDKRLALYTQARWRGRQSRTLGELSQATLDKGRLRDGQMNFLDQ